MGDLLGQLDALGASGSLAAGSVLHADASQFTNDLSVEYMWALKAHRFAEVYMKLIKYINPSKIKLTKFDDIIYRMFTKYFKDLNIEVLDEDDFKTEEAKARWRPFCLQFKGKLEEYNCGALIRKDCRGNLSDENSFLVTQIQFYAIEIARNRKGLNKFHLENDNNTVDDKSDYVAEKKE